MTIILLTIISYKYLNVYNVIGVSSYRKFTAPNRRLNEYSSVCEVKINNMA